MTATNEDLVRYFHRKFGNLNKKNEIQIIRFIENVLDYAEEIHRSNENNPEVLDRLPLLPILSEVQRNFPNVLEGIAKDYPVIATSLEVLSTLSDDDRDLMKNMFLKFN